MKLIAKILILFIMVSLLTACGKSWNVQVDLTPEETQAIQAEIQKLQNSIKNFVPPEEGVIDWPDIIELAKAYEKLGEMNKAVKVYTDVLDSGAKTKAIINNLGRLYDQVGEYELAVAQYQRLIDEYADEGYLYDITWTYIRAAQASQGDKAISYRKEAEKYFNAWQLAFQKTDEQTQQEIKKLRAGGL